MLCRRPLKPKAVVPQHRVALPVAVLPVLLARLLEPLPKDPPPLPYYRSALPSLPPALNPRTSYLDAAHLRFALFKYPQSDLLHPSPSVLLCQLCIPSQ